MTAEIVSQPSTTLPMCSQRSVAGDACPRCQGSQFSRMWGSKKKFLCRTCKAILIWKGTDEKTIDRLALEGVTVIRINERYFFWTTCGELVTRKPLLYEKKKRRATNIFNQ